MSGTSADGINVALVNITGESFDTRFDLLSHTEYPYPSPVRRAVLAAMNASRISVAELSRLNFLLGELYAEAVIDGLRKSPAQLELIGCHGQTLYHQGEPAPYFGKRIAATWQTGEGAVIAGRTGVPAVSDFRPADIAAGGQGAPLVPFLDYAVYRDRNAGRIVQNLGGIANLTAIPAGATPDQVVAFDTGPGNMVIDAVMEILYAKPYDRDGRIAQQGEPLAKIVEVLLKHEFFRRKPPKTAGREEFGREFVKDFLRRCGRARKQDIVATATALTVRSIGRAIRDFVCKLPHASTTPERQMQARRGPRPKSARRGAPAGFREYIISGGGARNRALVSMLRAEVEPMGLVQRSSDEMGVPSEAKEAIAFALLAYETWHRRPSNIPAATGARRPAILGKISYV